MVGLAGLFVGFEVGFAIGIIVGFEVEMAEGFVVGFEVGFAIGFTVGFEVGFAIGFTVGFEVGTGLEGFTAPLVATDMSLGKFIEPKPVTASHPTDALNP
jgi:uncharacterized protein YebE (UPF0316 family)